MGNCGACTKNASREKSKNYESGFSSRNLSHRSSRSTSTHLSPWSSDLESPAQVRHGRNFYDNSMRGNRRESKPFDDSFDEDKDTGTPLNNNDSPFTSSPSPRPRAPVRKNSRSLAGSGINEPKRSYSSVRRRSTLVGLSPTRFRKRSVVVQSFPVASDDGRVRFDFAEKDEEEEEQDDDEPCILTPMIANHENDEYCERRCAELRNRKKHNDGPRDVHARSVSPVVTTRPRHGKKRESGAVSTPLRTSPSVLRHPGKNGNARYPRYHKDSIGREDILSESEDSDWRVARQEKRKVWCVAAGTDEVAAPEESAARSQLDVVTAAILDRREEQLARMRLETRYESVRRGGPAPVRRPRDENVVVLVEDSRYPELIDYYTAASGEPYVSLSESDTSIDRSLGENRWSEHNSCPDVTAHMTTYSAANTPLRDRRRALSATLKEDSVERLRTKEKINYMDTVDLRSVPAIE